MKRLLLVALVALAAATSASAETSSAPGRVDSPPTSMICAPSAAIRLPCSTAFAVVKNSPPSEKESGVTFSTPMIIERSERSIVRPAIFQSVPPIEGETITWRALFD